MDLNRISSYPEHPEPHGSEGEFSQEQRPRSTSWGVATVGIATLVMVVSFFVLIGYTRGGALLLFGGEAWSPLVVMGLATLVLYLLILVFAPRKPGGRD